MENGVEWIIMLMLVIWSEIGEKWFGVFEDIVLWKKWRRCGVCEFCLRKVNCGECSNCVNRKIGY